MQAGVMCSLVPTLSNKQSFISTIGVGMHTTIFLAIKVVKRFLWCSKEKGKTMDLGKNIPLKFPCSSS